MRFSICLYLAAAALCAGQQSREVRIGNRYTVKLEDGRPFVLSITDLQGGGVRSVALGDRVHDVQDLIPLSGFRILVLGRLESSGHILTLVGADRSAVIDSFWASKPALAPDRRYVAYEYRYPTSGLPLVRASVLLLYDLTAAPLAARSPAWYPADIGMILYPEQNRRQGRYVFPALPEAARRGFVSPIVWNAASTKIAVLESGEGGTFLVVVDVSKGPLAPTVVRQRVRRAPFLADDLHGRIPAEYTGASVVAGRLGFVDADTAVEVDSLALGPFAAKTAKIRIGQKDEPDKEPAPPENVPREEFAIRVGQSIQDALVVRRVAPEYPPEARAKGIEGAVRFQALISPDGTVKDLDLIDGPPELVKAAEAAVRQWTYGPTILNGDRVRVKTVIEVRFRLKS